MKVIEVQEFGSPEVMELVERQIPVAGDGELVVRVEAIGVNPVETYIRQGTYPVLPPLPYTPGGNVAGVVHECGPAVEELNVGDRVYSTATISGAYGEYTLCSVGQLFFLPEKLSFSQGAALGVPAATAWRALFLRGEGEEGETLLIHGASGSVGQAATQLAKSRGMTVVGTAGSAEGCELVRGLGADFVYNHNEKNYEEKIQKAAGGTVDLILEMLANVNLERDLELLAPRGRVVIIGSRGRIEIDPRATMGKETDVRGFSLFSATSEEIRQIHTGLRKAIEDGSLIPTISREMPLEKAAEAHTLVMKDGNCGKIVLLPGL